MSDAKVKQSVERCKYQHEWENVVLLAESPQTDFIHCAKCGATPRGSDMVKAEAIVRLKSMLKPGDTVYTTIKHVSRSGMSRSIDVHLIRDNEPRWIAYTVALVIGWGFDEKREAVKVGGCGMDMGFHLVYTLSRVLWPNGHQCSGKGCGSNDHSNGDRNYEPHQHSDGGYALKQRWL